MSARAKKEAGEMTPRELRVAIAALFRAGFSIGRIARIFGMEQPFVEIELREYLLEARP